ncbi:hypothetical protein GV794_02055 [Nocardia cyriacigeorgica]|uniref:Uncharacterized protein n=1 Tax=Nocardia cyriacigeorgica TaxID=135487 RepID=A0ABX0CJM1_9NOCA|nr:hypothetical protein [Nocardia cyriacigeorgica]NEW42744.1 hypothetical protein [Nocardia cyriacigeorgica]NEW53961.1 hypothetical protein [Nocardia cyriacigeorgica]NEW54450.1 hypothetical protein [Nocardia cyriacigeorgica]
MSVFDDIRARIAADKARDASFIDADTLEGARADIVGEILKIAEHWADKAESWGPEEAYTGLRYVVCHDILEILNEHLWDEEG